MTDLPDMRKPKQDRSRVALERLMSASREILHEGTFEMLTIAEISKRSGVSVGSIYARFSGKEELFVAVMIEVMQGLDAEWLQLTTDLRERHLPLQQRVPALIEMQAEYLRRHAGMLRPFMARADDERIANIGKASFVKNESTFTELLLDSETEIRHPDAEKAVKFCFTLSYAALARFLGLGSASDAAGEGDWGQLKQELGVMCLSYLMSPVLVAQQ
ncbi:TPA: TetR/AcrR family transcriptional regulator [Kluyvera ascorbata]|uniref:TetR/AcrR family transcriptional regulator n=1 Tax=Kluyvera sp. Awk 3 TaxID=2963956 RepID=UPI00230446F3|nr:TetR/AcrR family transcriptional regulator [Kluyvera sp. Awk 3]MDA8487827.1 TetR/AcrR family transcriptional regulator [Kluyvera sp. Awk 3]HDT6544798.1 TetR/AcrR family transcriptional regulator [Kluyvera ascorbata]